MAAAMSLADLEKDPRLFLYTSLTSGSSHIITATSRLETILKANKIPFQAIDLATDEQARRLWQRRGGGRKLPGLVKEGFVLGDLNEVEEWNEFGELKENIGPVPASNAAPAGGQVGVNIAPPLAVNPTATHGTTNITQPPVEKKVPQSGFDKSKGIALPGAEEMAARNKKAASAAKADIVKVETMTSSSQDKKESIAAAKEVTKDSIEHSSAPASGIASEIESGSATPQKGKSISFADDPAAADSKHHGSEAKDVKEVPKEELKTTEKQTSHLEPDEEKNKESTKGVEDSKSEHETPQPVKSEIADAVSAAASEKHQGSELKEVPKEEVKSTEQKTPLPAAAEEEDVKEATEAPKEEVKSIEQKTPLPEADEEEDSKIKDLPKEEARETEKKEISPMADVDEEDDTTKGFEAMKIEHEVRTQEQNAKEPDDAGKSVED